MTAWEAVLLGIVQGITEFLPVSSSGHLELSQYFLGFKNLDRYIFFNVICHLGTLGSILYVFFPQIKASLTEQSKFLMVVVGTLPLVPLVFILKPIKNIFNEPQYLGICFLISALLIFTGALYQLKRRQELAHFQFRDVLTIGMFQALAILPGISRSGATISVARVLGWKKEEAVSYSFLLAIPAILGGIVIESFQLLKLPAAEIATISLSEFLIGFVTSFGVGCVALKLLIRMTLQDKWIYFAWYCLVLGLFTMFYFNFI